VPWAAWAQAPFATATAWEIQEAIVFSPLFNRLSSATLVGWAEDVGGDGLCARTGQASPCLINIQASSNINLLTGTSGQLDGKLEVLFPDLTVAATVTIQGTLDLGPLLAVPPLPVALASGKWNAKNLGARGTFEATFLVPVAAADIGVVCASFGLAYFNPFTPTVECLEFADFSLGFPVIKLNAELVRK